MKREARACFSLTSLQKEVNSLKSFHDWDLKGFVVKDGESVFYVTDSDVNESHGSVYKAVHTHQRQLPDWYLRGMPRTSY